VWWWEPLWPALATVNDTLLGCQATLQTTFLTCSCILHNFLMCHWDVTCEIGLQICRPKINPFTFGIHCPTSRRVPGLIPGHWGFFPGHQAVPCALGLTQPLKMSTRIFLGVKMAGA
jgi:hypothetical protein